MQYKWTQFEADNKRRLMMGALIYRPTEIFVSRQNDLVVVTLWTEEEQKKRKSIPVLVHASLAEWQALFAESEKLAAHLAPHFDWYGST